MITTDEKLIELGFKKCNTSASLSDARKYLFQKLYTNDKGDKLYYLDIYKWDWERFPVNVPEPYTYEITTQLYKAGTHSAINIEFGSDVTVEGAEEFINKLFEAGLIEPYESKGEN